MVELFPKQRHFELIARSYSKKVFSQFSKQQHFYAIPVVCRINMSKDFIYKMLFSNKLFL